MRKFCAIVAAIAAIVFYTIPAFSQLPNKILLEEATNASCPPCAGQNPILEQFLQDHSDQMISVSYHAWWPGQNDPMYTNDVTMNTARINYYGFENIGVPTCVIDGRYCDFTSSGWYVGAPGDTDALIQTVDSLGGEAFPTSLNIERYTQNDSQMVVVTVTSPTATSSRTYLRVIVFEKEHFYSNAGSNGETTFRNIARKMLPSPTGTLLSLAANQTKTFKFIFKNNANWSTDQLGVIAMVQTDADKSLAAAVEYTAPAKQGFPLAVAQAPVSDGLHLNILGTPMTTNQRVTYSLAGNDPVNVTFSVVDLLGRTVLPSRTEFVYPGSYDLGMNISALTTGVYRIVATTPLGMISQPIIIGQ